jgi:hypothetical protein
MKQIIPVRTLWSANSLNPLMLIQSAYLMVMGAHNLQNIAKSRLTPLSNPIFKII